MSTFGRKARCRPREFARRPVTFGFNVVKRYVSLEPLPDRLAVVPKDHLDPCGAVSERFAEFHEDFIGRHSSVQHFQCALERIGVTKRMKADWTNHTRATQQGSESVHGGFEGPASASNQFVIVFASVRECATDGFDGLRALAFDDPYLPRPRVF